MSKGKEKILILGKTIELLWKISHKYFFLVIILSVVTGLTTPIALYIWKNVIDTIMNLLQQDTVDSKLMYMLVEFIVIYLAIRELSGLSISISQYVQGIYSDYINRDIAKIIFKKLSSYSLEMYDDANLYNEIEKANNEASTRSLSILQMLVSLIQYVTSFVGTASILASLKFVFVLICIFTSIPAFYIGYQVLNQLFDVYNERFERVRFITAIKKILVDYESIKEVKIFSGSGYLIQKMEKMFDKNIQQNKRVQKKIILQNSIVTCIDNIFNILIKFGVIVYCIFKKINIGSIMMYISSVDSVKESIQNLLSVCSSAYEDCLYMKSFFFICENTINKEKREVLSEQIRTLEFKNVSFKYQGNDSLVLKNINLKLEQGKKYALVGSNGSGKSTLVKLLCNLYWPMEGDVLINGKNMKDFDRESVYQHIGVVFQEYIKYPLNIKENIAISNPKEMENGRLIQSSAQKVGMKEFIEGLKCGYNTQLKREWSNGIELSGGQWQRLAIARIFMKKFDVLILDEPSSALDMEAEKVLIDNITEDNKENIGVFITHRYIDTNKIDEIIVLEKGEIIEKGTHQDLIKANGAYKKIVDLQKNKISL